MRGERGGKDRAAPIPQHTIRFLRSAQEIEGFIALFEGNRLQNMVATFIYAGLRHTEACWLTWDDVDWEPRLLHVRSKTIEGEFWCPKTKRNRVVPISLRLQPFLDAQRQTEPHPILPHRPVTLVMSPGLGLVAPFRLRIAQAG